MCPTAPAHRLIGTHRKAAPRSAEPAAPARSPRDLPPQPSSPNANGDAPPADAHATDTLNGRDQNGRFAKGNPGGPGNPFARRIASLRQAFCDAVTQEGLNTLAKRLLAQAQNGDVAAAKLVLAYAIGKPVDPVNPDTLDQQEFQLFNQLPTRPQDVHRILNSLPTGLACQLVRILLPNTEFQIKKLWWKKVQRDMKKEERREKRRATNAETSVGCVQSSQTHPTKAAPLPNDPNRNTRRAAERQPAVPPTPRPDLPSSPPSPTDPNGNGRRAARRQPAEQATPRPNPPSDPPSLNGPNGKCTGPARRQPAVSAGNHPA